MDFNKNIGNRIRKIRLNLKLNQKEFANMFGISESTLANYKKQKTDISYNTIVDISRKCKCNLFWLLTGFENSLSDNSAQSSNITPEDLIKKLSDENLILKAKCFDLITEIKNIKEENK